MSIDWFTFVAQVVNFLILVWLLFRFLYAPITKAMDERERKIADTLADAATAQRKAEDQADVYRQRTEELAHAKEDLLAQAGRDVETWREDHLRRARSEVDAAKVEWCRGLTREKQSFVREARRRAAEYVQRMSRQVLAALANVDLEQRVIDVFIRQIENLDAQQKREIAAAIRESPRRVSVASAFPISQSERQRVVDTLHAHLTAELEVSFREERDLICGIELHMAGYKLAWSAREPLAQMEEEFMGSLDEAISIESVSERV